jgi:peptidyl-prolyl cis-trans isomerase A (cyclophilin A)
MKLVLIVTIASLVPLMLVGCAVPAEKADSAAHDVIVRVTTSMGSFDLRLESDRAPVTVENFLGYVDAGAYDGLIIHRVVPGFVIQGGGHRPDLTLVGEDDPTIVNEWDNGLTNDRGTIGMARELDPDSATRQWYINLQDNPNLSVARPDRGGAGYCVFGRIISGMEVVDAIAAVPTRSAPEHELENVPVQPIVIERVTRLD